MYTFERTAKYYETDQMGIVHHSNYIRWFEEARIALMEHMGIPYRVIEENGILIPVLGVDCTYKHPIRFDETIVFDLAIRGYNGVRFEVTYTGRHKATGQISCTGTSRHCFTTRDLKPVRIKQQFPAWHEIFARAAAESDGKA